MTGRLQTRLERLPVRVRVGLAFTAVMAILLVTTALFLYLHFGSSLRAVVNRDLQARSADVVALARHTAPNLGHRFLTEEGQELTQVLDPSGQVLYAPPPLRQRPLIDARTLSAAQGGPVTVDVGHSRVVGAPLRIVVTPVQRHGRHFIVVVGASLEQANEAQHELGGLLLIGGPFALLLAALAGYGAAAAALRPVETMRRRAASIRAGRPGRRLPVPPSGDEVARLGETLNEMLDRLEAAFARERSFVADASHELRTPLTILRGELELALRDADDIDGFRAAVASAAEEADRLSQLAEDLLVIARADQGRVPVRLEPVAAEDLLASVRRRFAVRAAAQDATIIVVADPGEAPLDADVTRLEQALGNLVDNALRCGARRIELGAVRRDDDRIELHVRDDGPGFAADFLPVAFERFTRADSSRGRGGAGLGLAIVDAIATAHYGAAYARNRSGGGADVWLALPSAGAGAAVGRAAAGGPALEPREREAGEAHEEGGDAVLDVVVRGAGLMAGEEGGQARSGLDPVDDAHDAEHDPQDRGADDESASIGHLGLLPRSGPGSG